MSIAAIGLRLVGLLNSKAHGLTVGFPWVLPRRRFELGLGASALAIEACLLGISFLERPASHVPEFISYYLLLSVPYLTACWLVTCGSIPASRHAVRWIWIAALLFRVTVVPLSPSLSEDTARYRWQGMLQDAGGDPYIATPEDAQWEGLRDSTWDRIAGKDKTSPYGPVLELLNLQYFRFVRWWEPDPWQQVWLFKLPFAAADLAVGLGLMALLSGVGRPATWALVYLWSPLPVTEFWIEGHNDALALAFVLGALALAVRKRSRWALVLVSVAALCKVWPIVLFPFLTLARVDAKWRLEWKGLLACVPVVLVLCLPYWGGIGSVWQALDGFTSGWRNNDSLFAGLLLLSQGDMTVAARSAAVVLAAAVVVFRLAPMPRLAPELAAICALLLLSANCFPWYLTWMLPLLAVHPCPPLLLWTALVPLAYHVVPAYEATGSWQYDRAVVGMEYAPVLTWVGILAVVRAWRWLGLTRAREAR